MSPLEQLARFVVETSFRDFPQDVTRFSKELVLSCLGGILAGSTWPAGEIVAKYVKEMAGTPEAGVIGAGFRAPAQNAAFVNGVAAHATELEDDSFPEAASTITLVPVILAVGEKLKLSGKQVLEAFILGYEVQGKMGLAFPGLMERGYMTLTLFGNMGAAAAATKLLGLDVDQTRTALSLAASQAGGLTQQVGSMAHFFESGTSCKNGILAAMLAKEGLTAQGDIIERPLGFADTIVGKGEYNLEVMTRDLGNPFRILSVGIKKYGCCWLNHRVIDAVLQLIEEHNISYDQVVCVEIGVNSFVATVLKYPDPTNKEETLFSLEHSIAGAILEKKVDLKTFTDAKVVDEKFKEARKKIKMVVHSDWEPGALAGVNPVTIKLIDGREYTGVADYAIGQPERPISTERIVAKYRVCARLVLPDEEAERVPELVLNLEKLKDITELMNVVTG